MVRNKILLFIVLILSSTLLTSCFSVGIEKAKYTVISKEGKFEVRKYQPQIVAETIVDSDFDQAGNIAFRRLFDYISGNNRTKESISMTAPVNQSNESEKISMTAPVNQQKSQDKWVVNFLMPSKYTLDKIPEPLNPDVTIREIPSQTIAAVRYSGTWSRKRYESHKSKLEQFISDKELQIIGEPIFARYDPPFQLWFLRRNEVLIPVNE